VDRSDRGYKEQLAVYHCLFDTNWWVSRLEKSGAAFGQFSSRSLEGGVLCAERKRTPEVHRVNQGNPSTFRRVLARITGEPASYDPEDDEVLRELKDIDRRLKYGMKRRGPSDVLEEVIFPRR
jgi:hypothetical protein